MLSTSVPRRRNSKVLVLKEFGSGLADPEIKENWLGPGCPGRRWGVPWPKWRLAQCLVLGKTRMTAAMYRARTVCDKQSSRGTHLFPTPSFCGELFLSHFTLRKTEAGRCTRPADPGPLRQPSASFQLYSQLPTHPSTASHRPHPCPSSLELVLPGAADLGGESLGQLLQAAGVLEFNLSFATEKLLEVLQQLQPRLGLLLQAFELLHQLRADLYGQRQGGGVRLVVWTTVGPTQLTQCWRPRHCSSSSATPTPPLRASSHWHKDLTYVSFCHMVKPSASQS